MSLIDEVRAVRRLPAPTEAKAIRVKARVTQARFAQELDVHRVTVARWERGQRMPRGELLAAYVSLLDQLREAVNS